MPENPSISANGRGDDLLDHAVDEVILLRVAAQIDERQHRDRRLVGQWQCLWRGGPHPRAGRASLPPQAVAGGGGLQQVKNIARPIRVYRVLA
jgi:hypothetical protein